MERSSQEDAWEEQASRSGGAGEAGDSAGTKLETESDMAGSWVVPTTTSAAHAVNPGRREEDSGQKLRVLTCRKP